MSSPEKPASPISFPWIPSSLYSPSTSESYAVLNETFSIHQHVRRMPIRHRAWWFSLSMAAAGVLFANVVWKLAPRSSKQRHTEPLEAPIDWNIGALKTNRFILPSNTRIVALVSYIARSRTSILDCYLQSNLAINDGLLDQIIFVPETGQERDMDWLHALVQSTPGYYIVEEPIHDDSDEADSELTAGDPETHMSEEGVGTGPFARAWNLALSISRSKIWSLETQTEDILSLDSTASPDSEISIIYIFIHGETIFLAHEAISQLLRTHLAHPSYAFIHANMINQPVLSWVHQHLGVIRPYRPETEPLIRHYRNKKAVNQETKEKPAVQHPWRASELPFWRDTYRKEDSLVQDTPSPGETPAEKLQDFTPTEGPSLFNIPIDFHSPFRGHRWLPYHPQKSHPLSQSQADESPSSQSDNFYGQSKSESIATPVTQVMMSLQRPGKWPWTLSALHLYSFLEHLECTAAYSHSTALLLNSTEAGGEGKYRPNCTTTGGLDRYNMGLWEYQSEEYGMSFFAINSRTVSKIGPLSNGVSETEVLSKDGGGMAVDGGSIAARFVGSTAEDGVSERRGLERVRTCWKDSRV